MKFGKWLIFPSSSIPIALFSWLKALVFWCWSLRKYFANPALFKISCSVITLSIGKFNRFKFWFNWVIPEYEILSPYWFPRLIGCCGGCVGGWVDCGGGCWGGWGILIPKLPSMLFIVEFNSLIFPMGIFWFPLFPPPKIPPIIPMMLPKGLGGCWFWGGLFCWGLFCCWGWLCYADLAIRCTVMPDSETYSERGLSSRSCLPAKTIRILDVGTSTFSLMRFLKSATFISLSIWN